MATPDPAVMKSSVDARELKNAAVALASSASPGDHDLLGRYLSSAEFLGRLDGPEAYEGTWSGLRLAPVVQTIMDNRVPSTDRLLLGLVGSPDFQKDLLRAQLLVRALGVVRPSPPEAVRYWDRMSEPKDPLFTDVVAALCVNQSDPALALLERKFADPSHDARLKVFLMRKYILPRRNDEPLLLACERMVTGSLPADLRPALVEALFDYQPSKWYRGCDPPKPPSRTSAGENEKQAFLRIGENALLTLPLSEEQKVAVRTGLIEFGHKGRR